MSELSEKKLEIQLGNHLIIIAKPAFDKEDSNHIIKTYESVILSEPSEIQRIYSAFI